MEIEEAVEVVREELEALDRAREDALERSREVVRIAGRVIRALHRGEFAVAEDGISKSEEVVKELQERFKSQPKVWDSGYMRSAFQEYVEASLFKAWLEGDAFPTPGELGVPGISYLLGLGDLVGELRRHVLDMMRKNDMEQAEEDLRLMEEIYGILTTFDYPESLLRGMRRKCDVARSLLERTRGEFTNAMHRERLRREIEKLLKRL